MRLLCSEGWVGNGASGLSPGKKVEAHNLSLEEGTCHLCQQATAFERLEYVGSLNFSDLTTTTTTTKCVHKPKATENQFPSRQAGFIIHYLDWQTSSVCFRKISPEAQTLHNVQTPQGLKVKLAC